MLTIHTQHRSPYRAKKSLDAPGSIPTFLPARLSPTPHAKTKKLLTTLFWNITQLVVVCPYRRFGITYSSYLTGCPETSVKNYYTLRNSLEERSSQLLRGGAMRLEIYSHDCVLNPYPANVDNMASSYKC